MAFMDLIPGNLHSSLPTGNPGMDMPWDGFRHGCDPPGTRISQDTTNLPPSLFIRLDLFRFIHDRKIDHSFFRQPFFIHNCTRHRRVVIDKPSRAIRLSEDFGDRLNQL